MMNENWHGQGNHMIWKFIVVIKLKDSWCKYEKDFAIGQNTYKKFGGLLLAVKKGIENIYFDLHSDEHLSQSLKDTTKTKTRLITLEKHLLWKIY